MPNERGTPFVSTTFKVRSCKVAFIWNHPTHSFVECKPTNWFGLNPPPAIEYKTNLDYSCTQRLCANQQISLDWTHLQLLNTKHFSFPLSLYKCFNNFLLLEGKICNIRNSTCLHATSSIPPLDKCRPSRISWRSRLKRSRLKTKIWFQNSRQPFLPPSLENPVRSIVEPRRGFRFLQVSRWEETPKRMKSW